MLCSVFTANSQIDINLYEQFNGKYDFTFVGNTLNTVENGIGTPCTLLTSSSESLNLNPDDVILKAYIYWAGSGTGDLEIKLETSPTNAMTVNAERTFPVQNTTVINGVPTTLSYFGAFADITSFVQAAGNALYTVSDFDLTSIINPTNPQFYCTNATNFGGWSILIIYENDDLPLNQLNLYDGMQFVPSEINITLPSLNVIDNEGAKIGFLAWEGDSGIANNESLSINNIVLSNALNPSNNAFNGTNSVTGTNTLYNMDLDIYDIQNMIEIGDETAEIRLTSNQDFVMVNAIITKLNSQLPDATITAENIVVECNSQVIEVDYTVYNINSTDVLPAGTTVAVYLNGDIIATTVTQTELPIGGSESGTLTITLPASVTGAFQLMFIVDPNNTVTETNEDNNTFILDGALLPTPPLQDPADLTECETSNGSGVGIFDFSSYEESLKSTPTDIVTFYTSLDNAVNGVDNITNLSDYPSTSNPQEIFVRLEAENGCYTIGSFLLIAIDCLLPDATVVIEDVITSCNSRVIEVQYSVNNFNSNDILPAGTPVSIYINGQFLDYTETLFDIAINGSEEGTITLTIPDSYPLSFELTFVVDDTGNGTGIVPEMDETNNTFTITVSLPVSPVINSLEDIISCNQGFGSGTFDFSNYADELKNSPTDEVYFYLTPNDAAQDVNRIANTTSFVTSSNPQQIFVRLSDGECYTIGYFSLYTKNCPPETYNYITPNGDGINDRFFVKGLRNIFLNFKMTIYNRWGALIWTGDHNKEDWDGIASEAQVGPSDKTVPVGTYYFVLELNDPDYPEPIVGWVYVSK